MRYPGNTTAIYGVGVSDDITIDCALWRGIGAYVNATRYVGGKAVPAANVRFVGFAPTKSARFASTKHIKAGSELFAPYGRHYWNDAGSHSTTEFPASE
jgi:hypothetical protein